MRWNRCVLAVAAICGLAAPTSYGREWTDSTGKMKQHAELVDFDSHLVVLKKADGFLVALPIDQLSKADQEYLKTQEAKDKMKANEAKDRTWTFADGTKIEASVVKYGRKTITFVRKNSQLYVNDKPFSDRSKLQQAILLKVVSNSERGNYNDAQAVENLLAFRKNEPLEYTEEGVLMKMPDDELLAVPFFMFSDKDLKVLQPGWQAWAAADKDEQRKADQEHMLRSEANEYQRNQNITHELQYLQFASQWFDLWEVGVQLPNGTTTSVVVPARNSMQATNDALAKFPAGSVMTGARVVSRR